MKYKTTFNKRSDKNPVPIKRRSFASFLWSQMWKEKKSIQNQILGYQISHENSTQPVL